ncbi:MAG: HEAT repeat domain-containing protein, partial [Anaerolineales bacterium]|nr:HEAT repeat domain-containing protein [Anaerolineales bacterium]
MKRLAELLTIRAGEGRLAGLLIALMLMTALGSSVGVSGIEALFFARFGVTYLPLIYMGQGVLTLIVTLGVSAVLGGRSRNFIYTLLPLVMGGVLVAERFLAGLTEFLPVLWLSKEILNSLMGLYVWGVASTLCDTRQAKRLFPIFNAGRILGSVAGGLATGALVSLIGTENLLLVWAATLGVAFIITRALLAGNRPASPVKAKRTRARRTPSFLQEVQQGYQFVRGSALMRLVSVEAVLFSALWFSLALPFSKAVTLNFVDEARIAGFLGLFNSLNTAVAFLASLFLANRLYARWGIMRVILVLPLIYVVGFGVMMAYAAFPVLVIYKFVQMVWLQGLADSAYQAMFNAVPGERRDQVRAFIGGVPEQAGTFIAGGILIVGEQTMQPATLYLVGLILALTCAYAVWRSGRAYSGALVAALKANQPQLFGTASLPFGGLQQDGTALQVALAGLKQPEPSVRRVAAEALGAFPQSASVEALVRALMDDDAGVRVAVLQALIQTKASAALLDVAARLQDANAEVRAQAVDAVTA